MSTSRLLMSRRTTMALALAAPLTLTGCDLDPPTEPTDEPATRESAPDPTPDAELVTSARTAISSTMASVEAAIAVHRRLRPALSPWLNLHAAHLDVLDDGTEDEPVEAQPPAGDAAAVSQRVLGLEADLATTLAAVARRAASGDLARVLASMSAALRQRAIA